ncbi:MAG: hypothetical protein H6625_11550 [Bdellovibrionaceae bacterium]|nr:hypothetical protein [Pseudobdellovibrionaceae bacterium]
MKKFKFVLLFAFLTPHYSFGVGVKDFCFDKPTYFNCIEERNSNFSLQGYFELEGVRYSISTRRAFDLDRCEDGLKKIRQVMRDDHFCIEGEVLDQDSKHITVNQVYNSKIRWTYFINPPKKEQIYEYIY